MLPRAGVRVRRDGVALTVAPAGRARARRASTSPATLLGRLPRRRRRARAGLADRARGRRVNWTRIGFLRIARAHGRGRASATLEEPPATASPPTSRSRELDVAARRRWTAPSSRPTRCRWRSTSCRSSRCSAASPRARPSCAARRSCASRSPTGSRPSSTACAASAPTSRRPTDGFVVTRHRRPARRRDRRPRRPPAGDARRGRRPRLARGRRGRRAWRPPRVSLSGLRGRPRRALTG